MDQRRVVLVTGITGYWGSRVAARLVTEAELRVVGLDVEPPLEEIVGLESVQADVRDPAVVELLKAQQVDTVCHLAFTRSVRLSEGAFDSNVMGTIKLLGACVEAGVTNLVLKSSTAVYGAHPKNSAFISESERLRGSRRYGYNRDMLEIERFCNGFRQQTDLVQLAILRFPSIIGPTADTPMTRFLGAGWTPTLLGFDPMMQLIHEDDVVEALAQAVLNRWSGAYNISAEGVLPLNKIRGLAGKPILPLFHLLVYWGVDVLGGTGMRAAKYVPVQPDYLRYRWVADLSKMRNELGFEPEHTAEDALREFAQRPRLHWTLPDDVVAAQERQRVREVVAQGRAVEDAGEPDKPNPFARETRETGGNNE
jgi:UDP-glucose 4-epimerase